MDWQPACVTDSNIWIDREDGGVLAAAFALPCGAAAEKMEKRDAVSRERPQGTDRSEAWLPGLEPATFSQTAQIASLGEGAPRLVEPISVLVEVLGDKVLVSDDQVKMYGTGAALNDALLDYRASLLDYFDWLRANEQRLASHLWAHLVWLRQRLRPTE